MRPSITGGAPVGRTRVRSEIRGFGNASAAIGSQRPRLD